MKATKTTMGHCKGWSIANDKGINRLLVMCERHTDDKTVEETLDGKVLKVLRPVVEALPRDRWQVHATAGHMELEEMVAALAAIPAGAPE